MQSTLRETTTKAPQIKRERRVEEMANEFPEATKIDLTSVTVCSPATGAKGEMSDFDYVEISDGLAENLKTAAAHVDALYDQLYKAQSFQQQLLDEAVMPIAQFKVGQDVISYGKRYRITKVKGEQFGLESHTARIWIRYHGERVKVDGSTMGRERRLYEMTPAFCGVSAERKEESQAKEQSK